MSIELTSESSTVSQPSLASSILDTDFAKETVSSSSPIRLAAAAHLYGLKTAPLENARVLELGCGAGANLLPFALAYPQAEVVGFDLAAERVDIGMQRAAQLGLGNLRLACAGFETIGPELGEFDFIIVNGVYGRVPDEANQVLLNICRANLSRLGVAYFSYNTYPGWKAADVMREAMMLHARNATTDTELIGSARAAASLMFSQSTATDSFGASVAAAATAIEAQSDEEFASDYLLGRCSACYFVEFADALQVAGLAHAGDAEPQLELAAAFGTQTSLNHSLVAMGQPRLMRQQYLDFMVGRRMRRGLVVHQEREHEILDSPDLLRLKQLRLAGSFLRLSPEPDSPKGMFYFQSVQGVAIRTLDPAIAGVAYALTHAWPATVGFQDLVAGVGSKYAIIDAAAHEAAVFDALCTMFKWGVLRYSLSPGPYDSVTGSNLKLAPKLPAVLASQAECTEPVSWVNLWHEPVALQLNSIERALIPLIDGKTAPRSLYKAARAALDAEYEDQADANAEPPSWAVSNLVDYLKRQCMISGSNAAWLAYFSAVLAEQPDERRYWYPYIWAQGWYARTAPRRTQSGYGRPNAAAGKEPPAKSMAELDNLLRTVSLARAEALARRLVSEYGQSSNAWLALGCLCRDAGNSEEALAALAKALAISPADVRIHAALGLVFIEKALLPEAEATYRTGLAIDPELPALLTNLGGLLRRMNRQDEALFFYSKALELKGGGGELSNVGSALLDLGKLGEASAHYRRAMAAQPENYLLHSNLLFLLSHDDTLTAEQLFQAHREFGLKLESKASRLYRPHDNTREPERKLRLGFVSADLYSHAMANFIDPIWSALDPQNFEIHAYSANSFEDDVTGKLRVHTAGWRMVANLGPDDLARQIRDDGIDILFDLSGHTGENRLAVFARKPAPIQITWMGYPGTTGLAAMDYYFLERHVAPRGFLDDQFTEKLVYMSATGVFQPENDSPDIGPAPVLKNGYVTFGSFNRPMKITESTMAGWGAILRALPHSRMLVGNMQGKQVQDMMVARFKEQQIGADRLLFRSRGTVGQYLQMHDDVDILLDSFPYTGGTTSYHALWMGVPILTLQGRTRVSRQTAEILALAGLKECVADTQEQWVENAVRLAGDPLQLAELRATMRERLTSSIQLRSDILIKDLQAALRAMWLRWCAGQAPASFDVDDRPLID